MKNEPVPRHSRRKQKFLRIMSSFGVSRSDALHNRLRTVRLCSWLWISDTTCEVLQTRQYPCPHYRVRSLVSSLGTGGAVTLKVREISLLELVSPRIPWKDILQTVHLHLHVHLLDCFQKLPNSGSFIANRRATARDIGNLLGFKWLIWGLTQEREKEKGKRKGKRQEETKSDWVVNGHVI